MIIFVQTIKTFNILSWSWKLFSQIEWSWTCLEQERLCFEMVLRWIWFLNLHDSNKTLRGPNLYYHYSSIIVNRPWSGVLRMRSELWGGDKLWSDDCLIRPGGVGVPWSVGETDQNWDLSTSLVRALNRWLTLIRWSTDQRWEGRSPLLWENQVEPGAIRRGLIALGLHLHSALLYCQVHIVMWGEMEDTQWPSIRWLEIGSNTDWPHSAHNDTMQCMSLVNFTLLKHFFCSQFQLKTVIPSSVHRIKAHELS